MKHKYRKINMNSTSRKIKKINKIFLKNLTLKNVLIIIKLENYLVLKVYAKIKTTKGKRFIFKR